MSTPNGRQQSSEVESYAADSSSGFKPIDLDDFPEVEELLARLDLGCFVRSTVEAPTGRNDVWAGHTTSGRRVFVKRLVGNDRDARRRMRRMLSFEEFSRRLDDQVSYGPTLLGADDDSKIVVFDFIDDARNGADLVVDETFDDGLAFAAGRMIGTLHQYECDPEVDIDVSAPPQPSPDLLRGIPARMFDGLSFGELAAWRLMQQDTELVGAVNRLREEERAAPLVPAHCDLRLDQFMITPGGMHVTDWEEFRYADGARDVGAFAGEWLNRSVLDIVTDRGDTSFVDIEYTHDVVLQRGAEKMERLLPLVRRFWEGYSGVRGELDERFAVRATAFAGWHLLDRLVAAASKTARLSGIQRAAAGVGRAAVLAPERFVSTLGFDEKASAPVAEPTPSPA